MTGPAPEIPAPAARSALVYLASYMRGFLGAGMDDGDILHGLAQVRSILDGGARDA